MDGERETVNPWFETEEEAAEEATRLNRELGEAGGGGSDYWTEASLSDGGWTVERRSAKQRSGPERFVGFVWDLITS
jgi:hypothetical protein